MQVLNPPSLNLIRRPRRNRQTSAIRSLVQETRLLPSDLVLPCFLLEGTQRKEAIPSMPGVYRLSLDLLIPEIERWHAKGVQGVILFPYIPHERKDNRATEAYRLDALMPTALRMLRHVFPSLCLMADLALDPFSSEGHDGVVSPRGSILNDETVAHLAAVSLIYAEAGADYIAPSDMMDGRVGAIRAALDAQGFIDVGIISYCAKYASSLYAPFRDALDSAPRFGDKLSYQMHPANRREALIEAELDAAEGADILMVKPALHYLDVVAALRQASPLPLSAFHVSGEYAMVMAAHQMGYLDAPAVFYEALLSIKRAGADFIFTYAIPHLSL